ncbi:sulfite exporter TauE/SafE family protein [Candidatus Pacearchaeota archaeon]|nr:sulfite exporter TauE/SafE family protein [Candidatus Pacearchaeota archaeon]
MSLLANILSSFVLGLLTPLTAVCVLPLYPGFLAFLSNKFSGKESKKTFFLFGLTILSGIIIFMILLGLIFTTLLQKSLTNVIGIVSPIAFAILGLISLALIFEFDFSRFLPKTNIQTGNKNPLKSAFIFGFFFGAIVLPCNPAFITAFFARALLFGSFFSSMSNFLAFGLGLGFPLLVLSLVSGQWSKNIIGFLIKHKRTINLISGLLMLGISVYYLFFVFKIFS